MELLAPAGNWQALVAAVQNGADAVYFGGGAFNARMGAENFSGPKLREAVAYCRLRGAKAYITLNTLLHDNELEAAFAFAKEAGEAGADALIVQDLGLARLLKNHSDIPLHASTQMALHNREGMESLSSLGFSRVVLARETPLEDIRQLAKSGPPLEVFVHGALCVGFSGLCYYSSLTGGRSGNRGTCAQCCRQPASLLQNGIPARQQGGYPLSTKDLCLYGELATLQNAGVCSLKIEGRLKRPEYVATVVGSYRRALDALAENKAPLNERERLLLAFNRGGFTKGPGFNENALFGQHPNNTGVTAGRVLAAQGQNMLVQLTRAIEKGDALELRQNGQSLASGVVERIAQQNGHTLVNRLGESPEGSEVYLVASQEHLRAARGDMRERPFYGVIFHLAQTENALILNAQTETKGKQKISATAQTAYSFTAGETSQADILAALQKTGGSPFYMEDCILSRQPGYIPAGVINGLRRQVLAQLADILQQKPVYAFQAPDLRVLSTGERQADIGGRVTVITEALTEAYPPDIDIVFSPSVYSEESFLHLAEAAKAKRITPARLGVYIPPVLFSKDILLLRQLLAAHANEFGFLLAGGPHGLVLGKCLQKPVRMDYTANVLNSQALLFYKEMGAERVCLSPELNGAELQALQKSLPAEVIALGRLALLFTVHCPKKQEGCGGCANDLRLRDRKGFTFLFERIQISSCLLVLRNCVVQSLHAYLSRLRVQGYGMQLYAKDGAKAFLNGNYPGNSTTGHYKRGV